MYMTTEFQRCSSNIIIFILSNSSTYCDMINNLVFSFLGNGNGNVLFCF